MRIKKSDFLPKIDVIKSFTEAVTPNKGKPWESIVDFATHRDFGGNNLYPRQLTLLKLIYLETEHMTAYDLDVINQWSESFADKLYTVGVQEDIWDRVKYLKDNGYGHFRHIESVMGRRAGKGHIGGILQSERMAALVGMDNPQRFFGIDDGHDIYSYVIATSTTQAQKFLFADVLAQVRRNKWLRPYVITSADHLIEIRTPADIRQTATLMANGTPPRKPIATIKANPVSSNSSSSRGGAVISAGFDEFAFTPGGDSQRSGENMYNAIEPSLDQFGKESMIYIPSSPWNKIGKFYQLYENGSILLDDYLSRTGRLATNKNRAELEEEILEEAQGALADPEMLIVQLESWGLYLDWQDAPRLLSKPNPNYHKRTKERAVKTRLVGRNDELFYVSGEHALEIGDSILVDKDVVTLADVSDVEPDLVPEGSPVLKGEELDVVIPGPKFESAIQVEPDISGDTKERAMARMEAANPDMFRVERRAQFLSTQNAFLDRNKVESVFDSFWGDRQLSMRDYGVPKHTFHMHADPAKSGADFAVMIAHTEQAPEPDVDGQFYDHLIVDWYKVYQPRDFDNGEINYLLVLEDIKEKMSTYPTLRSLTMDQFNSVMPLQTLKKYAESRDRRINISEQTFTNTWNQTMFSALKTAINLGWVHSPVDNFFKNGGCLLEQEMLFLEEHNGRVTKGQNEDVRKDDLVDCLGVLTVQLLGSQISSISGKLDEMSMGVAGNTREKLTFNPNSEYGARVGALDALNNLYD